MWREFCLNLLWGCKDFKLEGIEVLMRPVFRGTRMVDIDLCYKYRLIHRSLKEIGQELGGLTVWRDESGLQETKRTNDKRQFHEDIKHNQCNKAVSYKIVFCLPEIDFLNINYFLTTSSISC